MAETVQADVKDVAGGSAAGAAPRRPRPRYAPVLLAMAVAAGLSVVIFLLAWTWEKRNLQASFNMLAANRVGAVRRGIETDLLALDSLAAFYAASREVDRTEFRRFVAPMLDHRPGIRSLQWAPRVLDADRPRYEQGARRDGYPGFQFTQLDEQSRPVPADRRPEYFPIFFMEPLEGNPLAMGLDQAFDPVRREALELARQTGRAVATPRLRRVSGGPGYHVVVYRAVYRPDAPNPARAETRPEHVQGMVMGLFDVGQMIEGALAHQANPGIVVSVYDLNAPRDERWLYTLHPDDDVLIDRADVAAHSWLQTRGTFEVAGRRWAFVCTPTHGYLQANRVWKPWTILLAGLSFTALLGAYLLSTLGRAAQVEHVVQVRTAELENAKASLEREIAGHQRTEQSLRDSEALYHSLVETLPLSIFRKDLEGRFTFGNQGFCATLRRTLPEILGRTDHDFYPPDLADKYRRNDLQVVRSGEVFEAIEEHHDAAGDTLYVQVLKAPVYDSRRQIIGIEGIFWDVTERKRAEAELRTNQEMLSIARQIQDGLYPRQAPDLPGFDIAGASHHAAAVGGDYYDFIPMSGQCLGVVIGDASGHGIGPALVMAQTRACLHTLSRSAGDACGILRQANRILTNGLHENRFVTLLFVQLQPGSYRLQYCGAGHPTGYVLDAAGAIKDRFDSSTPPLGIAADADFAACTEAELAPGDLVVLLTDGVTDAMAGDSTRFGIDRALAVVREHRQEPARQIVDALCAQVREFSFRRAPHDDLTAVVIKCVAG